jgi:hypothetical protein
MRHAGMVDRAEEEVEFDGTPATPLDGDAEDDTVAELQAQIQGLVAQAR